MGTKHEDWQSLKVGASTTDIVFSTRVSGDAKDRFQILANGTIKKGTGGASPVTDNGTYDGFAGVISPSIPLAGTTTAALTANTAYLTRFVPIRDFTATVISFAVSTASGTDDPCDVGIYDSSLTRLVSAGATSGKLNNGTGMQSIAITSTDLTAGTVYYAAFAANSTASLAHAALSQFGVGQLFGTTVPNLVNCTKAASYPLPASIASPSAASNAVLLGIRES